VTGYQRWRKQKDVPVINAHAGDRAALEFGNQIEIIRWISEFGASLLIKSIVPFRMPSFII
jgi:hypothetical protein